jgi:hypothetical protein
MCHSISRYCVPLEIEMSLQFAGQIEWADVAVCFTQNHNNGCCLIAGMFVVRMSVVICELPKS